MRLSFFPPVAEPGQSTTVTFEGVDDCGNLASLGEDVTVVDTTPPTLAVPAPLEIECNSPGGVPATDPAVVAWLASASSTDVCGSASITDDLPPLLPSACGPGKTTTVTFVATDGCGNATSLTSTITVKDTTPPELDVPAPLELECNSPGGIPASDPQIQAWLNQVVARDVCGGVTLTDDSPQLFPSGCGPGFTTTVRFDAVDDCGQLTSLSSTVTVRDTTPPSIAPPAPLELECDGTGGIPGTDQRILDWLALATATDSCDGAVITDDSPAFFPSGCGPLEATEVQFEAVDNCGNDASSSSKVTVRDTTAPALSVPQPLVLECSSPGGVPVTDPQVQAWLASATASDVCGTAAIKDDAPALFPSACGPGATTTVTFTATDDCGNAIDLSSTVTVRDTTPPTLTTPGDITVECSSQGGVPGTDPQIQAWLAQVVADDACGGVALTHDLPAFLPSACGAGHPTTVNFRALDDCGLETLGSATITVRDTTPPDVVAPPPLVLECDGPGGIPASDPRIARWLASATAIDVCDGAVITNDAPPFFASGCVPGETTLVTFIATDNCGNTGGETSPITVVDTTPPEVESVGFDGICLWPPNHKYYCIDDVAAEIVANDICDEDAPTLRVVECRSSQPDDDKGDGHTVNDCITINDGKGVCLRSERLGNDPRGRDYTVVAAVSDDCGNTVEAEGTIHVPHDKSSHPDCRRPNR